jgi:hypothetical protein
MPPPPGFLARRCRRSRLLGLSEVRRGGGSALRCRPVARENKTRMAVLDRSIRHAMIDAKAVKSYLTFAIVIFAASPAYAQAEPARAEKAYLRCLLAHTLDERLGDEEKSVQKCLRRSAACGAAAMIRAIRMQRA